MGMLKPEVGEAHRFVIELPGTEKLTQEQYVQYKNAIEGAVEKVGKPLGAQIKIREFINTKHGTPPGKGGK